MWSPHRRQKPADNSSNKDLADGRSGSDAAFPLPHGTGPNPTRQPRALHKDGTLFTVNASAATEWRMCTLQYSSCGEQLWPVARMWLCFHVLSECRRVHKWIMLPGLVQSKEPDPAHNSGVTLNGKKGQLSGLWIIHKIKCGPFDDLELCLTVWRCRPWPGCYKYWQKAETFK